MQNKKINFTTPFVLGMVSTFALSIALLSNANAGPAVIITPTAGTASVDGNTSEWDTSDGSADFSAKMCEAGRVDHSTGECDGKDHLSNLYLRYDCNKDIMYVLVLAEAGYWPHKTAQDAWVKIYDIASFSQVDGNSSGFSWVAPNGVEEKTLIGYEASFSLDAGIYDEMEAHIQIKNGRTSSTGKKADPISIAVPEDCEMPPVDENETPVINVPQGDDDPAPLLATNVDLMATLNGTGVDLTLTTSTEPDTAALLILRGERRGNDATKVSVVCEFPSGGSPYTCTDNVVGDVYYAAEIEYDGSFIIQNKDVKPKKQ